MAGYATNIDEKSFENRYFRTVRFTGRHRPLLLRALQPGEEIGTTAEALEPETKRGVSGIGS